MPFLIDGYNLLRWIQNADEDFQSINDIWMCLIIDRFLKLTAKKGRIIFDGVGPPDKSGFKSLRNLKVFFAGASVEADKVIEDMIKSDTAPKRLTVVSSDLRIKKAACARKAVSVKSEVFWVRLVKFLARRVKSPEPKEKRIGISQGETELWMKLFGLKQ
jgi:predicted RNA-binding protein with PIN domain